jgi:hypothetical protein
MPETGIIENDEQHVGGAFSGAGRFRPGGFGNIVGAAYDAGEGGAGFVLFEGHWILLMGQSQKGFGLAEFQLVSEFCTYFDFFSYP